LYYYYLFCVFHQLRDLAKKLSLQMIHQTH
jgi:hypothetical protein